MVRIQEKKLIIEIACNQPTDTLIGLQNGLLSIIEIANTNIHEHASETIKEGLVQTSRLLKETLLLA